MIYLPDFNSNNCIVNDTLSSGYIRVYEETPRANSTINYIDYFIDYDYIPVYGQREFGNYSYFVNCQPHENYTTSYFYRNDFDSILVIVLIMSIFILYIPLKIILRFFRRFQ